MLSLITTVLSVVPVTPALLPAPFFAPQGERLEAPALDEDALEERLERLVLLLEEERVSNHIPGLALAVVHGDEIVLARGFGMADLDEKRPVDTETLFGIGSCSKAFTATLIGLLQDEGTMSFDDAVTEHLPYFELPIEGPDAKGDATVTLRDLMSHRTGFTRMGPLFLSDGVPTRTILETATRAEPMKGFREAFLYTNVMYLAAGTATAETGGASWEELIHTRLFEPLSMNASKASIADVQADERLSVGYLRNVDTGEYTQIHLESLNAIGPAGGISSNVVDMAQWLRFQLARGEYAGERVLSESVLIDTWTSNVTIGQGLDYSLRVGGLLEAFWRRFGGVLGFRASSRAGQFDAFLGRLDFAHGAPVRDLAVDDLNLAFVGQLADQRT